MEEVVYRCAAYWISPGPEL